MSVYAEANWASPNMPQIPEIIAGVRAATADFIGRVAPRALFESPGILLRTQGGDGASSEGGPQDQSSDQGQQVGPVNGEHEDLPPLPIEGTNLGGGQ